MDNSFLSISGWVIAVLALIVNVIQLFQNNSLKKKIVHYQQLGNNSTAVHQNNSGTGDNTNAGRDVNILK